MLGLSTTNEGELLDSKIELNGLKAVLKNCPDNKAPGPDRVPYEFYKNSPQKFR